MAILSWLPLLLGGCGGSSLAGSNPGTLQASTGNVSFGSVSVGKTATASVSLVNLGTSPVQISNLNVTGQSFSLNGQNSLPITLAATGGTYNVNVQFDPSTSGAAKGLLTVTSDAAINGTEVISLSGTGLAVNAPAPTLTSLACSNNSMIGSGTDACTVTLNAAAADGGFSVNLASNSATVTVPSSVMVAAGATSAAFSAVVTPAGGPQTVRLTASAGGVSENFALEVSVASPGLTIGSSSLAFGSVAVNAQSTQAVTLSSTGAAAVTVDSATVAGAGFSILGAAFPLTLSPGQSATLSVQFDPSAAGPATGQLTIASDGSGGASSVIGLSGTGVPVLSALSCTNASITGLSTDACTVSLNAAAASGGFAVGLSSSSSAVTVPATITVPAGAATASFSAAIAAVSTGQSAILTAHAGTVSANFTLQLNAAMPALTISATSIAFGNVAVSTSTSQSLTLSSTGNSAVSITSATLSGSGFSISGVAFPVTLNPNQSVTLTVQFNPSFAGSATGQLTVASNSTTGASTVIGLSGTGIPVLSSLTCSNSTMTGAGTDACTITLNAAAASGGFTVGLASSRASVSVPTSASVAAGSTSVGFTAAVSSVPTAQVVTLTASAGTISKTFALQLNAAVPILSINAVSISFGDVNLNTPATQSITLTSTGAMPVTVSSVTISGPSFSISGASFPVTLNSSQTATLSVQFDPTTVGSATGQLTVSSNSSTNGTAEVGLSGVGQAASYVVNLTWNAPIGSTVPIAGYDVYRAPSGSSNYRLLNSSVDAQTAYVDSTVQNGQTYDYEVETVDTAGVSSVPSSTAVVVVP